MGPSNIKPIGSTTNGKAVCMNHEYGRVNLIVFLFTLNQYIVTVPNSGGNTVANFSLIHVYGTPYEMGMNTSCPIKRDH